MTCPPRACTSTTQAAARILRRAAARRSALARAGAAARPGAPAWARRLYERSLLVLHALTDRRRGAVAAGARDGWAYVWPRDAGGRRDRPRRRRLPGRGAARGAFPARPRPRRRRLASTAPATPVPGRAAEGDAAGWVAAAARAAGVPAPAVPFGWRNRPDYQEKSPGDYLANALASARPAENLRHTRRDRPVGRGSGSLSTGGGWCGRPGTPASGLDSAAAWAVRPFPRPRSLPGGPPHPAAARRRGRPLRHRPLAGLARCRPLDRADRLERLEPRRARRGDRRASTAARDRPAALRLLADLRRAATPAGLLPERVDARTGVPRSTTPLAWSHAFAALALRQLWPGRSWRESR